MTSNLYILTHKTEPRFKIGKANCINSRIDSIGYRGLIDEEKSMYVATPTERDAFKLEGHLHYLFDESRLEKIAEDGGSEWFNSECMGAVKAEVEKICAIKGFDLHHEIPKPVVRPIVKSKSKHQKKKSLDYEKRNLRLLKFRELRDYLNNNKENHIYYINDDCLHICTSDATFDSTDGLIDCGIYYEYANIFSTTHLGEKDYHFVECIFVTRIQHSKGNNFMKIRLPNGYSNNADKAHIRMHKWLMATLESIGAENVTARMLEQRNKLAA